MLAILAWRPACPAGRDFSVARIRTIKPEIWQDERFTALSLPARLLCLGMISNADDAGRIMATALRLAGDVFPADDVDLGQLTMWRDEIADAGMIVLYEVAKITYAYFPRWGTHQKISHPSPSKLPEPPSEPPPRPSRVPPEPLWSSSGRSPETLRTSRDPINASQLVLDRGNTLDTSTSSGDHAGTVTSRRVAVRNTRARPTEDSTLAEAAALIEDWWMGLSPKPSSYQEVCESVAVQLRAGWRSESIVPALNQVLQAGYVITRRSLEIALRQPARLQNQLANDKTVGGVLRRAEIRMQGTQGQLSLGGDRDAQ